MYIYGSGRNRKDTNMNMPSGNAQIPVMPTITQEFACHALPGLFHNHPEEFLKLLEKDGNLFLRFYWNEAAKRLGIQAANPPFGLNYVIKQPAKYIIIVLIALPAPVETGDSYFISLVFRPLRVMLFPFIQDRTAVFLLEKSCKDEPDEPIISRITRKLEREETGAGSSPQRDEFSSRVIEILEREN